MSRRQRIEDLTEFALPEQPALSPDGREVVYVLPPWTPPATRTYRAVAGGSRDGAARRLTTGTADAARVVAGRKRVAFLRAGDGPAQVWLLPAAGGEPERLTALPLGAGAPVWSPTAPRSPSARRSTCTRRRERTTRPGRRATAPVVRPALDYKADGAGLLRTIRKHLHVVDLDSGRSGR